MYGHIQELTGVLKVTKKLGRRHCGMDKDVEVQKGSSYAGPQVLEFSLHE